MKGATKSIPAFALTNIVFATGLVVMVLNHIRSGLLWAAFILIWCTAATYVSKNMQLSTSQWMWLILGFCVLDIFVIVLVWSEIVGK